MCGLEKYSKAAARGVGCLGFGSFPRRAGARTDRGDDSSAGDADAFLREADERGLRRGCLSSHQRSLCCMGAVRPAPGPPNAPGSVLLRDCER